MSCCQHPECPVCNPPREVLGYYKVVFDDDIVLATPYIGCPGSNSPLDPSEPEHFAVIVTEASRAREHAGHPSANVVSIAYVPKGTL